MSVQRLLKPRAVTADAHQMEATPPNRASQLTERE